MTKIDLNLQFLFNEYGLIDRYKKAAELGYKFVELQNPYGIDLNELKLLINDLGLKQVLINVDVLDEQNTMLGHRWCRLVISFRLIYDMQCRAIFEELCVLKKDNKRLRKLRQNTLTYTNININKNSRIKKNVLYVTIKKKNILKAEIKLNNKYK